MTNAAELMQQRPLRLELGCGTSKRDPSAVGIDMLPLAGVDVVGDALAILAELPSSSVAHIYSEHFMEHVDDAEAVLREASRVLEPGGVFRAVVPHFSNPSFYSDPTHQNFFGLYTFNYWVRESYLRKPTPQYIEPLPLRVESITLRFKGSRPWVVRHALKKAVSSWVNTNRWTQEFYEENLVWIMPCYELDYAVRKI